LEFVRMKRCSGRLAARQSQFCRDLLSRKPAFNLIYGNPHAQEGGWFSFRG